MQADMDGETLHKKLEGKMTDLFTKLDTKLYQKIRDKRKRENGPLCGTKESHVQHAPSSTPILEKFNVKPTGVGV